MRPQLHTVLSEAKAKIHKGEFPEAAETVQDSSYMDDSMHSVEDSTAANEFYHQLCELWQRAGKEVVV